MSGKLTLDQWSFDVTRTRNGITTNHQLVSNEAFGTALSDFSAIEWHLDYGLEKSFFDDSGFTVSPSQIPEPGTLALIALGGLLLGRTRASVKRHR
jgi:hypothetical protein